MTITIDEKNLKNGVLGIAIALVEIIRDALKVQAFRRMESGTLADDECERLGKALMEIDMVLEEIKREQGIAESVQAVRDGLDEIVNNVIDRIINPGRWPEENNNSRC
ncbi:MAG: gas vesicle protein K [Chloroflexi bacterium]|nr:gas vesicle protein K [Chloroflexota bacterium]